MIADQEFGPLSSEQLRTLAREGRLAREDRVRASDGTHWVTAKSVSGLFSGEPAPSGPPQAIPVQADGTPQTAPPVATPVGAAAAPPAMPVATPVDTAMPVAKPLTGPPPPAPFAPAPPSAPPGRDGAGTVSHLRKRSNNQLYLVGGVIAAVGLLAAIAILALGLASDPDDETDQDAIAQAETDPEPAIPTDPESDPIEEDGASELAGVDERSVAASLPSVRKWYNATRQKAVLKKGEELNLRVQVLEVGIEGTAADRQLCLKMRIENTSSTSLLEYRAWSTTTSDDGELLPVAADDQDAPLAPIPTVPRSQVSSWRIKPGDQVDTELAFQSPRDEFQFVRVALPYAAFGEQGYMGFEVPSSMIKDAADDVPASQGAATAASPTTPGATGTDEGTAKIPGEPDTIDDLRSRIQAGLSGESPVPGTPPDTPNDPGPSDPQPDSILDLRESIRDNTLPDAKTEPQ
jgi:hypothetical protein